MASKYIQNFPIPNGFPEILHDLSKEILRHQPDDIIDFAACYFKCIKEGIVLKYENKGTKIPCDFEINNPSTAKRKPVEKKKRKTTKKDEDDHMRAVEQSKVINDPAKVMAEQMAKERMEEGDNKSNKSIKSASIKNEEVGDNKVENNSNANNSKVEENKNVSNMDSRKSSKLESYAENNHEDVDEYKRDLNPEVEQAYKQLSETFVEVILTGQAKGNRCKFI